MGNTCVCSPIEQDGYRYSEWLAWGFGYCAYSPSQRISFLFGLANLVFWIFAQVPQIWINYRGKRAEALSFTFLFTWLAGDITGLVGCILAQQLPTQLYTAIYYCFADGVLLAQWYYYLSWYRTAAESQPLLPIKSGDGKDGEPPHSGGTYRKRMLFLTLFSFGALTVWMRASTPSAAGIPADVVQPSATRVLLEQGTLGAFSEAARICNPQIVIGWAATVLGYICAWICGLLYFFGRIPQVYHNWRRKSVEGLSWEMFICAALGNLCYCVSILLSPIDPTTSEFWLGTFPYILGSGINLLWPCVTLVQFVYYNRIYRRTTQGYI